MTSSTVRLSLLGGFRLERDDVEIVLPGSARRLVALLGLWSAPDRGAVAGELWPDVLEHRALGSLRSTLHRLKPLCPGLVQAGPGVLRLGDGVRVDVREVGAWARAVLDGDDGAAAVPLAPGAFAELLPGWYDDWVLREREQLRQLRMHALEQAADRLRAAGRLAEARRAVEGAVRLDPLRESAYRRLLQIHLAEGNVAEALREFEALRRLLAAELGVPPSPRLTRLVEEVRSSRSV